MTLMMVMMIMIKKEEPHRMFLGMQEEGLVGIPINIKTLLEGNVVEHACKGIPQRNRQLTA